MNTAVPAMMGLHVGALLAALGLAGVYALRIGAGTGELAERIWTRRRWVSAAAGITVAYVFVDVLPELAAQSEAVRKVADESGWFIDQRIYFLALLSFVVMYGIEHIVLSQRGHRASGSAADGRDAVYWLHVGGFAAYGLLIGYLLIERAERGGLSLALYAFAMAVHFVVVNHALAEEHGERYRRRGHWVLALAVLAGWGLGSVVEIGQVAFARLFAVLAGGVVITSLKAELPDDRVGRFWPFCLAAMLFALVLMLA
jgi:hypothetical protein